MSYRQVYIQAETLQKLIDFAHAAMGKREDHLDESVIIQSRIRSGGNAPLTAKDLREVQKLGKPSWEKDAAATAKFFNDRHDARVDKGNQPLI